MEHRQTNADEEMLEVFVEQGSAADEEAQFAAKTHLHLVEKNAVEEGYERTEGHPLRPTVETALAVVRLADFQTRPEEFFHHSALASDVRLDAFLEALGKGRHGEDEVRTHLADVRGDVLQRL